MIEESAAALRSWLFQKLRGPVSDSDVWHRPVTNKRHLNKNTGKLSHAALKKKIDVPEHASASWKSELSGRLRSIATTIEDIRKDGNARAAKQRVALQEKGQSGNDFEFIAIAHSETKDIRKWALDVCDVIYDARLYPKKNDFDLAHANLTFGTKPPEGVLSALEDVISRLRITPEAKLKELPAAKCRAPRPYRLLRILFSRK